MRKTFFRFDQKAVELTYSVSKGKRPRGKELLIKNY